MSDTLLYKKNKREGFRLVLFVFLALLAIVAILPFSLASEDTQMEEQKLVDIFPNIYATLMDQNGKIVSTTDPNKTVDNIYKNTSSTRYLSLTDNYYLYLETEELKNEKLNEKIVKNKYYYLNLPEEFLPDSNNVITNQEDELELFNLGNLKGYGGIYYTDNIYQLKVRFDDINNSFSAKLSYQYSLKLTDKIYEQDEEQKIVNIEDLGSLIFYVKNKEIPKVSNYTLKQSTTKKGLSEDIYTLTTTLTDIRDEENRIINGKLTISLDNDFGFKSYDDYGNVNDFLKAIKVYVDGEELELRTSTRTFQWYYSDRIMINATATSFVDIDSECTDDSYSCLINKIEFEITGGTTDNAIGVREIKIVFDEKLITTKYRDHTNSAIFEDKLENVTINTNYITHDITKPPVVSTSITNKQYTVDYNLPSSFVHEIDISSVASNYVELTIDNYQEKNNKNNDIFQYYIDSTCLFRTTSNSTCDDKLNIYVDGNLVPFEYGNYSFNHLNNGRDQPPDPMVYMQMKEVLGDEFNNLNNIHQFPRSYLWRSINTNIDGEYYYVLISYDSYNYAYDSCVKYGGCEYTEYINYLNRYISPAFRKTVAPSIKLYLFNTSNHNVKLKFGYNLGNVVRNDNRRSDITDVSLNTNVKYENNYSKESNATLQINSNEYISTTGELLNNNVIKWETIIDTREMDKDNAVNYFLYVYPTINLKLTTYDDHDFYSIPDKKIVSESYVDNRTYLSKFLITYGMLYRGNYNPNTNKCEGDYKNLGPFYDLNNSIYNGNFSNSGIYGFSPISVNENGITTESSKICFVYFTKINNNSIGNNSYYGIQTEFDVLSKSKITNSGLSISATYVSKSYVNNSKNSSKSLLKTKINETTTSNKWQYNMQSSNSAPNVCYNQNAILPYSCSNNYPLYNGNLQFYDKMDGPLAKYTYLDNIEVTINGPQTSFNGSINFSKSELGELDNEKCVRDICVHISYPVLKCDDEEGNSVPRNNISNITSCATHFYGNDYLSKLTKMDNGFSVMVTGLKDTSSVEFTYETITDDVAALNDINNYNSNIDTYNYIYENAWHYMEPYDTSDLKIEKAKNKFTRKYAAGIAVEKTNTTPNNCIETNSNQNCDGVKTYLTADTNKFKVNALVGQSSVSYVDINDKLISFMGNDSLTDEDINTFMKYLKVNNLKITYKANSAADSNETTVIYQNGEFVDEWSNSTIAYENIGNNFYSIHLVNNDNVIPAQSVFEIEYDLVFDIDNYRNVEGLDSYRNNNLYNGEMVSIKTDVEAIIPYNSSFASIEDAITSNNKNYIDSEKTTVHCFLDDYVNGDYLRSRKIDKILLNNESVSGITKFNYGINVKIKSVGKLIKPKFDYYDILSFDLSNIEEDKKEAFMELLVKHMTISNMKIVGSSTIYENNNVIPFSEERIVFSSNGADEPFLNGTFNINKSDNTILLSINGETEYDSEFNFYYSVNLDEKAFVEEAIRKNLLDSSLKVIGTNSLFTYKIVNNLYTSSLVFLDSVSSGRISFSSLTPTIEKSVTYPSTDEQRWTLRTNSNQKIHIVDNLTINGDENIINNISIGKIVIKIDNNIIYENGEFKDSYGDNVKVNINGNKLEFDFEDEALSENTSSIEIQYSTLFDRDAYYESTKKKSGSYSLSNSATIERNGIEASTTQDSRTINFDYPFTMNKSFLGNGVNLATSNWRIEVFAKDLQKEDIVIKDTVNLTSDLGSYLSISNMIIKKVNGDTETIVYDYNNKINNLSDRITIKNKDSRELEFNKNGEYEFIINVDKLEKDEKLIVDYELKVDEDKYKEDEKETGVEINIPNTVVVSSREEEYTESVTGKTTVESTLTKKFRIISRNTNTASIEWNININLDADYEGKISNSSNVRIIDELFDSLEYIDGSLNVYSRISTGNSNENKLLKLHEDYEFVYEDHTIKIKLLNPSETKVILIAFNTTCSSTEGLKNYVELEVDDEKIHESTDFIPPIFLRFIGGTIISKQSTAYSFTAKKLFNNEPSSRIFKFNLKEVDVLGQPIDNGINITVENDTNGDISFGSISYYEEGIHFYRIKEINEGEANVTYDSNEYTIMVQVGEYNNAYLIEKAAVLSNNDNKDEIVFNNIGGETSIEVNKIWNDSNDRDGKRKLVNAKVQLYKSVNGGEPVKVDGDDYLVAVPTSDGLVVKWNHLPVYEDGNKITYSVREEYDSNVGYIGTVSEPVLADVDKTLKITINNSYSSEETSIEVTKIWDDENNIDNKRELLNAKIQLYKSVNGDVPVKVSGNDYFVKVPTTDGIIVKWEHLPVYENKNKITYSIKEEIDDSIGYIVDNGENVLAENGITNKITVKNSYTPIPNVNPEENSNNNHTEEIHNIPKTNDNIIYSFIAFFISIGVFIYLLVYLNKNKKKTI